MKSLKIVVGIVLFMGMAVSLYHVIGAQRASAQTQEAANRSQDSTLWFPAIRSAY